MLQVSMGTGVSMLQEANPTAPGMAHVIPDGARVVIFGLKGATDLNGAVATVEGRSATRVAVQLDDGARRVAASPACLRVLDLGAAATPPPRPPADEAALPRLLRLPDQLAPTVLSFAGPYATAACGRSCSRLHALEREAWALWRGFAERAFGLRGVGSSASAWRAAYALCAHALRENRDARAALRARVVEHSDDVGEFRVFHPPEAAVRLPNAPNSCWSTSCGAFANVDLVARFAGCALVLGVAVANCHEGVGDNPAKDVLGFLEYERPDLARTREFDDGGQNAAAKAATQALARDGTALRAEPGHPVARATFPPCPDCYGARVVRPCAPTVANYVHFKILSSHNPNEHDDPNVDVHELHALGVSVPGLTLLLEGT